MHDIEKKVFAKEFHKNYKQVMNNACQRANDEFKKVRNCYIEMFIKNQACNKQKYDTKTKCVRSAVIAATEFLENDESINAGNGSSLTINGTIEGDAGIFVNKFIIYIFFQITMR